MMTRCKGQLRLKDWAFAIAKRSTMRKARVALARRLAIMHAMLRDETEFTPARRPGDRGDRRPKRAPARSDARGREQTTAPIVLQRPTPGRLRFQQSRLAPSLPIKPRASTQRTHAPEHAFLHIA